MAINIEVVRVEIESKGKYQAASVIYKGQDGKVDNKKLVSFANKEVFKTFSQAQPGDMFEVGLEKDTNGYWQWVSATASGKNTGTTSGATGLGRTSSSPRSTYETPEERAARQVYIVRQSSISAAIEVAKHNNPKGVFTPHEVIDIAKEFEAFVFAQESVVEPEVE